MDKIEITKPVAFVDIDATVAELGAVWLGRYNQDYNDNLTDDDIKSWATHKYVKPECGTKIYDYLRDPTLYDEILPTEGALKGVNHLREIGYRVVFATSSPISCSGRKFRWLVQHGFLEESFYSKDYIEISDKGLLVPKLCDSYAYNLMIDDGIHNVKAFRGISYLYRRPHNENDYWKLILTSWKSVMRWKGIKI